jgi:hypothetical protein
MYGTCPNCKTSVKLPRGSERAEPSETAERCPDPSDRTTVQIRAGGEEPEEMPISEAIEVLDAQLAQLYDIGDARAETVDDLAQQVEERGRSVDDLERGVEEVAGYFKRLVEQAGGEVDYDHVEPSRPVLDAVQDVDTEAFEA